MCHIYVTEDMFMLSSHWNLQRPTSEQSCSSC